MKVKHPVTNKEMDRPSMLVDREGVLLKLDEWENIKKEFSLYFSLLGGAVKATKKGDLYHIGAVSMANDLRAVELPQDQGLIDSLFNITGWFTTENFKKKYPDLAEKIFN